MFTIDENRVSDVRSNRKFGSYEKHILASKLFLQNKETQ